MKYIETVNLLGSPPREVDHAVFDEHHSLDYQADVVGALREVAEIAVATLPAVQEINNELLDNGSKLSSSIINYH